MKLRYYLLNEWKVNKAYAGRDLMKPGRTVVWMLISMPSFLGLLFTLPDGTTFLNNKKIGVSIPADDGKATHKKYLADFFQKLGLDKYSEGADKRTYIEEIYEQNVRGRIIEKNIYVYSDSYVGIEAKKYNKMVDKAIDYIYDYVDEDYYAS